MNNRRGNFALKFPNNKTVKFRTREAYSYAFEVMSRGRFTSVGDMYSRVKKLSTGFEIAEPSSRKVREFETKFNGIDFED
jgi:hypothetical protein